MTKTFLLWIMCITMCFATEEPCRFARHLRDTWYSGTSQRSIVISATAITGKGVCVQQYLNHYLMQNIEIGCYSCVRFSQRNHNILQYQESHCGGSTDIHAACEQISSDMWHTLFREIFEPAPCPFQDAYHFGYNNNSGGFCRFPFSSAKACASEDQYRFQFEHCPVYAYTFKRDINLVCLGSWHIQKQLHIAVQLNGRGIATKQQQFRCSIYKPQGTLLYMSLSADASCRGLRSHTDGPVVMEMTKDVFSWKKPECTFPHWRHGERWRDLSGHLLYAINKEGNILRQLYRDDVAHNSSTSVEKAFRCQEISRKHQGYYQGEITALTYSSHDCSSFYQCIKYILGHEGNLHIYEGQIRTADHPCTEADFATSLTRKTTLISESQEPQPCPMPGRYLINTASDLCESYLRIACNASDTQLIDIKSSCSSKPGRQLFCVKSWQESRIIYLIAARAEEPNGSTNCFSFRYMTNGIKFGVDMNCNAGTPHVLPEYSVVYTISDQRDECQRQNSVSFSGRQLHKNNHHENKSDAKVSPSVIAHSVHYSTHSTYDDARKARDHRTKHITAQTAEKSITSSVISANIILIMSCWLVPYL